MPDDTYPYRRNRRPGRLRLVSLGVVIGVVIGVAVTSLIVLVVRPGRTVVETRAYPDFRALQEHFRKAGESVEPSVVAVRAIRATRDGTVMQSGSGSGFAFAPGGLILTNEHVIHGANDISVVLHDGGRKKADLVGRDERSDLAVLKIDYDLPPLELRQVDTVHTGDLVCAMGNVFGEGNTDGRLVFSAGIVSRFGVALDELGQQNDRQYTNMIQISGLSLTAPRPGSPIDVGSSGGPLVNLDGQVVGVNTAIDRGRNAGYAIPFTARTLSIIQSLRDGKAVNYGWLGVTLGQTRIGVDTGAGVLVREVMPDSPAHSAGIERGDRITAIDGRPVNNVDQLMREIGACVVGQKARVQLVRGDSKLHVEPVMGDREQGLRQARAQVQLVWRGATVVSAPRGGVRVLKVEPNTPADLAGLLPGDIIAGIGGLQVEDVEDFRQVVEGRRGQLTAELSTGRRIVIGR